MKRSILEIKNKSERQKEVVKEYLRLLNDNQLVRDRDSEMIKIIPVLSGASSIVERIEELNNLQKIKESTLKLKERELVELEEIWWNFAIEVDQIKDFRISKFKEIFASL